MRLLLDTCVWGGTAMWLRTAGHDVVWAGDWQEDPGDEAILARARAQRRILVTLDKDFGEMAVVRGLPHFGIVRLVGLASRDQGRNCLTALEAYEKALQEGAIVTVERGRTRLRPGARADE
ncbi:MAG: DUF5615 family PIN-like protein [Candidatus Riflebacteria bacterium]|nr:DUF5615 family PIN-like protein [Candidatus Riflebacteria bacterium]